MESFCFHCFDFVGIHLTELLKQFAEISWLRRAVKLFFVTRQLVCTLFRSSFEYMNKIGF
jgi:hypothetical protein